MDIVSPKLNNNEFIFYRLLYIKVKHMMYILWFMYFVF